MVNLVKVTRVRELQLQNLVSACLLWLTSQSPPSKATTLERTYGPAWIAYGHSFAVESEHDQAMAAYFTAAQLMKGCVDSLGFL